MDLLLSSIAATAITFRKELSGQSDSSASHSMKRPVQEEILLKKVLELLKNAEYEIAFSYLDRLVKLEDKDPLYYALLGDCYTGLGKVKEALENYDSAIKWDGKSSFDRTGLLSSIRQTFYLPEGLREVICKRIEELEEVQIKLIKSGKNTSLKNAAKKTKILKKMGEAQHNKETNEVDSVSHFLYASIDSNPMQFLEQIKGVTVSVQSERLELYERGLQALMRLINPSFIVFESQKTGIFIQLLREKGSYVFRSEIGGLTEKGAKLAKPKGFRVFDRHKGKEGTIYQSARSFKQIETKYLAQLIDEMFVLLTENEMYTTRVSETQAISC